MNFFSSGFHFKNEVEFDGSAWIWWIRKKKWFKAQQIKGDVNPCFIQISKYQVLIIHNFGLIEYTFVNGSISYIETEIESIDLKFFKSCALFFEKNYQRLIIAMGFSVRKIPYECSTLSQTFFFQDNFFLFQNAYLYNYDANSWKQLDFLANQASNMPIFALFNEIYQIVIDDFSSISLFKYDQYFKNRAKVAKIDDFYGNFSKYKSFSAFDYHERHFV